MAALLIASTLEYASVSVAEIQAFLYAFLCCRISILRLGRSVWRQHAIEQMLHPAKALPAANTNSPTLPKIRTETDEIL
jgi:hypothetical protein